MTLPLQQLRDLAKRHPRVRRSARLARRRWIGAARSAWPNWRQILADDWGAWQAALKGAADGPRVLIPTSIGAMYSAASLESVLGVALTLRGARVEFLLCDKLLPACMECDSTWYPDISEFVRRGPQGDLCQGCFEPARQMLEEAGFRVHRYSEQLTPGDYAEAAQFAATERLASIKALQRDGVAIGEHALAGALRFFARATLEGDPHGEAVLRRYLAGAMLTAVATRRLVERERYDAAVFNHGIYVPFGLIGEVARAAGVRVVNWNPAYRKQCFVFSHGTTYHHTLMNEPVEAWEDMPWDEDREAEINRYLKERWHGTSDWIRFHAEPTFDAAELARVAPLDPHKPVIGLLTNVMWDAQLHYPANAFADMREWVLRTIEWFAGRPDLQLLIRVHPAELRGTLPSRQPIVDEIRDAFPQLPPNVFVVPPESSLSTYALMERCDSVIIYGTKTGVELTSMGIPVIVAGEAWIRNKGLTLDAASGEHYFELLDALPMRRRLAADQTQRARKYAYHFFFRRMIPLSFAHATGDLRQFEFRLSGLRDLNPGAEPGLDVICDGVLRGEPFIFDAPRQVYSAPVAPAGV